MNFETTRRDPCEPRGMKMQVDKGNNTDPSRRDCFGYCAPLARRPGRTRRHVRRQKPTELEWRRALARFGARTASTYSDRPRRMHRGRMRCAPALARRVPRAVAFLLACSIAASSPHLTVLSSFSIIAVDARTGRVFQQRVAHATPRARSRRRGKLTFLGRVSTAHRDY